MDDRARSSSHRSIASAAVGVAGAAAFRRFPRRDVRPLGEDAREILRFVAQSSGATGIVSLRTTLTPMLLGVVSTASQVGYFRVAQSPQAGFNAVSAPIRLVLLADQTRDWERGRSDRVFAGVRRYTLSAALGGVVLLPLLLVFMPQIVRLLFTAKNVGAVDAARIIVAAGAVQFVVGWSKIVRRHRRPAEAPHLDARDRDSSPSAARRRASAGCGARAARPPPCSCRASSFALTWARAVRAHPSRAAASRTAPLEPEIVGLPT